MTSSSGPVQVVDGRREGGLDTLRVATGARGHRRRREGQGARTLEIRHFWPKYPRWAVEPWGRVVASASGEG